MLQQEELLKRVMYMKNWHRDDLANAMRVSERSVENYLWNDVKAPFSNIVFMLDIAGLVIIGDEVVLLKDLPPVVKVNEETLIMLTPMEA